MSAAGLYILAAGACLFMVTGGFMVLNMAGLFSQGFRHELGRHLLGMLFLWLAGIMMAVGGTIQLVTVLGG